MLFLSCVFVSVSGVLFSVGVCVCVCDLLIFYMKNHPPPHLSGGRPADRGSSQEAVHGGPALVKCLWGGFVWGVGMLFLSCVCVGVGNVVLCLCVCV